ncbi:PREDICTED: F-box protein SKIP19-like [Camelina sativa]|uniref:F-box protein SKIP19-like n=1 Tax=Camelina sativa TaxID=90675 RepID=A0ABM0VGN9_CAMSA|nr:PREDICTED: F-box protein SKIP19-like [Camelina sativa]
MSASSSTLVPPLMMREEEEPRDWTELPSDLTSLILLRVGAVEILENAQKVCKPWRRICENPSMWQKINMRDLGNRRLKDLDFDILCRHAVDLSQGGLLEINLDFFSSDSLLAYIADRSMTQPLVTQMIPVSSILIQIMACEIYGGDDILRLTLILRCQ